MHQTKLKLKIIIDYLKKYEYGETISHEVFEQALLNTYIAKGMSGKAAQSLLDRTMSLNERRAKKTFNTNGVNCFYVGRTSQLEL